MKDFYKNLFLFILPLFILGGWFEYKLHRVPNSYNFKRDQLAKVKNEVQAIFLGTSHIHFGIDPSILKEVKGFNLANVGQDIIVDSQLILKLRPNLPSLKYVIWGLDNSSIGSLIQDSVEKWRNHAYRRYYQIAGSDSFISKLDIMNWSAFFLLGQSTSLHFLKNNFKINPVENINSLGFQKSRVKPGFEKKAEKDAADHELLFHQENLVVIKQEILLTKKRLEGKGIKVLFIRTPVHKSYREKLSKKMHNAFDSFKSDLDFIDYPEDLFTTQDFADSHHLNNQGAEKLTVLIEKAISF